MSDYIACLIDPTDPDFIELITSHNDPRVHRSDGFDMLRERGWPKLEWTLRVVDGPMTMKAITRELHDVHHGSGIFECDPMVARGKAVTLTTQRAPAKRPGLLARLGLRRRAA